MTPPLPITPKRRRISRRALLRTLVTGLAVPASAAGYATQVELFWPEYHEVPLPVRNLPPAFDGMRIAHLSDLHVSDVVPLDYIRGVIRAVNALRPDIVFLTGDLVTRSDQPHIREACEAVAELLAPTYVSLGNHDYGRITYDGRTIEVAEELELRLTGSGCVVLRNRAVELRRGSERVWVVGLEDLWSGRFSPAQAFAKLDLTSPVLALSHNPDTAAALETYGAGWVFAGHTHGGQIRIPGYGAVLLPVQDRRLQQGLFQFGAAMLYVSRGVGFLARARFCCRPEVPIFVAQAAPEA